MRDSGYTADAFATHADNVAVGVALDLIPLYTLVSNEDDWDRYQSLRWRAAERHAQAHPDDPDLPEILERTRTARTATVSGTRRDRLGDLYPSWLPDGKHLPGDVVPACRAIPCSLGNMSREALLARWCWQGSPGPATAVLTQKIPTNEINECPKFEAMTAFVPRLPST
ncbi:MAG: hypothetical protein U0232_19010 [Thermomicrobiales bacterium]